MDENFNPILNNPYDEPSRHYQTGLDGTLNYQIINNGRRLFDPQISPIPIKKGEQLSLPISAPPPIQDHLINRIRKEVINWRELEYKDATRITRELLNYWFNNPIRSRKLFFAQREAIETTIWLNEIASRSNNGQFILNRLEANQSINELERKYNLPRIAFKIATGGGKTVVMAMQILYHYLNRQEYRNDTRFSDYFLVLAPGITIKDRLSVLRIDVTSKYNQQDYYHKMDLIPPSYEAQIPNLNSKIVITNRHSLERKVFSGNKKSPLDGKLNNNGEKNDDREDFNLVLRRVLGRFKRDSRLLIINDEGHHCYYPKEKKGDSEIKQENARAAVWFNGIMEISQRYKLTAVYDLSATPYYLKGSGYEAYTLFPWVVSDFGLIEAMESGLVKIPFMPEGDDTQDLNEAKLKNIFEHVKDELPKKGKGKQQLSEDPQLPTLVKNALEQFYANYKKEYERFTKDYETSLVDATPVFIIVCNNTSVSSEVFRYIAGYKRPDGTVIPGQFDLLSNYDKQNRFPLSKPPTLLIDSTALDEGDQINEDFLKEFAPEIEQFKREYKFLHPDKSVENISESDLLREVVNTVGKPGTLGSHIRCVVSVSMLTEGWDANTVTHIMGIRAFGSQLLCEQVVGRALRRISYDVIPPGKKNVGKLSPEFASVIGVPFNFMPGGKSQPPSERPDYHRIFALQDRTDMEICFPHVSGYRIEIENDVLKADFSQVEKFIVDNSKYPTETQLGNPFSPEIRLLSLQQLKEKRRQELEYTIAKNYMAHQYRDYKENRKFQYFPQILQIVRQWLDTNVLLIGDAFINMLFHYDSGKICQQIQRGIVATNSQNENITPLLNPYQPIGASRYVNGITTREVYPTRKSHVNYVVADTDSWEQLAAKALEEMKEIVCYVKNAFLGFSIPYVKDGKDERLFYPDFIARIKTPGGKEVNLIIEITGFNKEDKAIKGWYTRMRWLPAVNSIRHKYPEINLPWEYLEIADEIRDIKNVLRDKINTLEETK